MSRHWRKLALYLLSGVFLALCLAGCEVETKGVWLCSVNKDGTGFTKILKNDYTWSNWQRWDDLIRVYAGNNGKLVLMYSDGLKVYDTSTKVLTTIFTQKQSWYFVWSQGFYMKKYANIVFSADGNKAFYTVDDKLEQLDLATCQVTDLYTGPWDVSYPLIDDTGNLITMRGEVISPVPVGALLTYHLDTQETDVVSDVVAHKACLSGSLNKYFYTMNNNICSVNTDGSGSQTIFTGQDSIASNNDPYVFAPFADGTRIVTTDHYWSGKLLILNTADGTTEVVGGYGKPSSYSDIANQTVSIDHTAQNIYFAEEGRLQSYEVGNRGVGTIIAPSDRNSPQSYLWLSAGWDNDRVYFIGDFGSLYKGSPTEVESPLDIE